MADQPITKDLIADIVPDTDTDIFTIGDAPAGTWGKFTIADLVTVLEGEGVGSAYTVEDFTPPDSTNTVTLSSPPSTVDIVFRNGLALAASEYSVLGSVITFTQSFGPSAGGGIGQETVKVVYVQD